MLLLLLHGSPQESACEEEPIRFKDVPNKFPKALPDTPAYQIQMS